MRVHFAGLRSESALLKAGVKNRLVSFFEICKKKTVDPNDFRKYESFILDSGVYSFMYGEADAQKLTEQDIIDWQDEYTTYIKHVDLGNAHYVEQDVQKLFGPAFAWDLRRRLVTDLGPDHGSRIINVYHLEDGDPTELCKYADYVGFGMIELRKNVSRPMACALRLANIARNCGADVHLFGMTELRKLPRFRWCRSCDSTSWMRAFKYGRPAENFDHRFTYEKTIASANRVDGVDADAYWAAVMSRVSYKRYAGSQN